MIVTMTDRAFPVAGSSTHSGTVYRTTSPLLAPTLRVECSRLKTSVSDLVSHQLDWFRGLAVLRNIRSRPL